MEKYFDIILKNPLFHNIDKENLNSVLNCLNVQQKKYKKNEFIVHQGDKIDSVGIILSGNVQISKSDFNGKQIIISEISAGDIFAETFACADLSHSLVSISATCESKILLFSYKKIISTCNSSCEFHQKLILNMLKIMSRKNLYLNQRLDILSKRGLREKILCYFEIASQGSKTFKIPFNREEFANFLCVDRSALSNELSKMQKDGIISYKKNFFEII